MAKIQMKPIPKDDKAEALAALEAYKVQNPVKYEQKKAALFAFYGVEDPDEKKRLEDEERFAAKVAEEVEKAKAKEAKEAEKAQKDAEKAANKPQNGSTK